MLERAPTITDIRLEHTDRARSRKAREAFDVETLPTAEDIRRHFEAAGKLRLLEQNDPTIDRHTAEQILVHELETDKMNTGDECDAQTLRGLIWSYSKERWNRNGSAKKAIEQLRELANEIRNQPIDARNYPSNEVHELEDALEARAKKLEEIAQALWHGVTGEPLKDSVEEIEYLFSKALHATLRAYHRKVRKTEERTLSDLRIIRDALYERFLFPRWTELKQRTDPLKKAGRFNPHAA